MKKEILLTFEEIWEKPDFERISELMKEMRVLEEILLYNNIGEVKDINDVLNQYYEETKRALLEVFSKTNIKDINFDEVDDKGNLIEIDLNKKFYEKRNMHQGENNEERNFSVSIQGRE